MNVSRLLDPIQDASALLDARNINPRPTTKELKNVRRHLERALKACLAELKRRAGPRYDEDKELARLPCFDPGGGGCMPDCVSCAARKRVRNR